MTALNRQDIARSGKRLEYFTIVWNSLDGLVVVVADLQAASLWSALELTLL
jgi:hypothetical protein